MTSASTKSSDRLRDVPQGEADIVFSPADKRAYFKLKKDLAITCADKANQDFAFSCPIQYATWIVNEVSRHDSAYRCCLLTEAEIRTNLATFLTDTKVNMGKTKHTKFAVLKCIIKYHKKEASKMARFIAASKNTYNSNLALRLNKILGFLVPSFEGLWTKMLVRANVKDPSIPVNLPSWVATDSNDVVDLFRRTNKDVPKGKRGDLQASTWDFSTLYTTFPHDLICEAFDFLFEQVFGDHAFFAYNMSSAVDSGTFIGDIDQDKDHYTGRSRTTPKRPGWNYLSLDQLKKALSYLIRNTYVKVGDKLFWQWLGIPMGTNPAVHIANYCLFYYELRFMNRLVDWNMTDILKTLLRTKRYIDDLVQLSTVAEAMAFKEMVILEDSVCIIQGLNGAPPITINMGIYPRVLVCNLEQEPSHKGHCLDVDYHFDYHTSRWYTDIYSKTNDIKYKDLAWNRYPNIRTKLSTSCKYNVITSQVYRFFHVCSRKSAVIYEVAKLIYILSRSFFEGGRDFSLNRCFLYLDRALRKFIPMWNVKSPRYMLHLVKKRLRRMIDED